MNDFLEILAFGFCTLALGFAVVWGCTEEFRPVRMPIPHHYAEAMR